MDPAYISLSSTICSPRETRESIISVVKQKINTFATRPELLKSFYNNQFNVDSLINNKNNKVAIFVIGNKPLNSLTNILINQVYDIVKNNNINMSFIIDGIDDLPVILNIEDIIDTANEGKIDLILASRNKKKLSSIYGPYTLYNIEKEVLLTDNFDEQIIMNKYELPTLKNDTPEYFNFINYIKKNF